MDAPPAKPPQKPSTPSSTSARVARERLTLLLLQERHKRRLNPPYLPALKGEVVGWLARQLDMSPDAIRVFVRRVLSAVEQPDQPPVHTRLTLEITVPLPARRSRRDAPSPSPD